MAVNLEYVFRETVSNLKRNVSMASAALLTVAVSLTLVGGALLVKRGVDRATVQWKGNVELSIFMKADASQPESEAIDRQLKSMPEVKTYRYVSKPEAFEEFKQIFANEPDVRENVAFALEVIGARRHSIERTVPEVLKLVGLQDKADRFPHELSGGEQQRVSIARAFVNRPLLMLCDEPTGNLDPTTSQDIMRLLERINRTGTTVVMATHDERIVDQMRKRVVELEHGKVVRDQERGVYDLGV